MKKKHTAMQYGTALQGNICVIHVVSANSVHSINLCLVCGLVLKLFYVAGLFL